MCVLGEAKQNKTKQNETRQDKTKQDETKHSSPLCGAVLVLCSYNVNQTKFHSLVPQRRGYQFRDDGVVMVLSARCFAVLGACDGLLTNVPIQTS